MLVDRRKELGKNIIFPPVTTPHSNVGGVVRGENNLHRQSVLDETTCRERSVVVSKWRCFIMGNDSYHRIRNVSISKDAIICPVLSQVVKKDIRVVVAGD